MTKTVGNAVTEARRILQDLNEESYRYPTSHLCSLVTQACQEARRVRPDLFLGMLTTTIPTYTESDFADELPITDSYFPQVVNYVVGRAELRDDQFSSDGRAAMLVTAFGVSLTGGKRE